MIDESTFAAINDPAATSAARLTALKDYVATNPGFPEFVGESNNHIHTIYSFSPYTPAAAALRGRIAGLAVVGSVDHDSYAAAAEMREATRLLGMGCVTGFEARAFAHSPEELAAGDAPFANRMLNNPDSPGIMYLTVQGVPAAATPEVAAFLKPTRKARLERTRQMAAHANQIFVDAGITPFDFDRDLVGISQYQAGGEVTERHLLSAMATALINSLGRGAGLVQGLKDKLGLELTGPAAERIGNPDNPHLMYDLLGVMKAEYLATIYIQPTDELHDARTVVEFAKHIGAIPAYAYLGDVTESPTGDKKAEKFEDDYLDELFEWLPKWGFPAVTYMPPRNTAEQMARISTLAKQHRLVEVSGVDINQPSQSFNCPELRRPELAHLNDATWALVAHERLTAYQPRLGLFSDKNPLAPLDLYDRIKAYAWAGRTLVQGHQPVESVARDLLEGRHA